MSKTNHRSQIIWFVSNSSEMKWRLFSLGIHRKTCPSCSRRRRATSTVQHFAARSARSSSSSRPWPTSSGSPWNSPTPHSDSFWGKSESHLIAGDKLWPSRILWWHNFVSSPPSTCSLGFSNDTILCQVLLPLAVSDSPMTQFCVKSSFHLQSQILQWRNFVSTENPRMQLLSDYWGMTHICVIMKSEYAIFVATKKLADGATYFVS